MVTPTEDKDGNVIADLPVEELRRRLQVTRRLVITTSSPEAQRFHRAYEEALAAKEKKDR